MYWNALYCGSGDNTLASMQLAIQEITKGDANDYFVFVLSDANLNSYGISGEVLTRLMIADPKVNVFTIFIAGESNAHEFAKSLPLGHGFCILDTSKMPKIFKEIFSSSILAKYWWINQQFIIGLRLYLVFRWRLVILVCLIFLEQNFAANQKRIFPDFLAILPLNASMVAELHAQSEGILFLSFRMVGSAPSCKSNFTVSAFPDPAAMWSGVSVIRVFWISY